jgi:hypothetical protein
MTPPNDKALSGLLDLSRGRLRPRVAIADLGGRRRMSAVLLLRLRPVANRQVCRELMLGASRQIPFVE